MLVVHFMCSSDAASIPIISIPEHFKALVYEYIVYEKIGESVAKNPQSDRQSGPKPIIVPPNETANTNSCVKNKK